jgi:DNA-binding Lrp family transcriptional regulator
MKGLDQLDLKMMEAIGAIGPRNVTKLARKLGVPAETMRKRLIRLRPKVSLYTNIYHTNIGLKKAFLHAQSIPGKEQLLFDALKANDFWLYVNRCYGINEGCLAVYTIPQEHAADFEKFVARLQELNIALDPKVFWSTCFQAVHSRVTWFKPSTKQWVFEWDKWMKEIPTEGTQLPKTLTDPRDFPQLADEKDIMILKELEKDPTVTLIDMAKTIGISEQLADYHYKRHILSRGLLESFEVFDFRFDMKSSDMFYFFLTFDNSKKMTRFASSLLDKPFVLGLGKILGENALIAHLYLPKQEFRSFVDILSKLIALGHLQSYRYVIQDMGKAQRQTIAYEHFKKRSWTYDHEKHIQALNKIVGRKLKD